MNNVCRDMSGRRLRHVNTEKKLEEWNAEAEERKLEKMAEEFIKKKAKEYVGDSAKKYVAKYRKDSAKCMEEVERSVRESIKGLASSKRKSSAVGGESDPKQLKIWGLSFFGFSFWRMGKRKFGDSDSEDDSDEDEDEEGMDKKSVILDSESHSDSSKEAEGGSGSILMENMIMDILIKVPLGVALRKKAMLVKNLLDQVEVRMYMVMMAQGKEIILL
ncbi:UNVERIFIED_CONTAM: hypothetical protein Sradi_3296900 [Sesamum radiatum]|uniref:SDE2-like domain-containing protein n=1 Tax=Sesamum radiatum TaxID=300843 RepID=A0AAW2R0U1_SESRA